MKIHVIFSTSALDMLKQPPRTLALMMYPSLKCEREISAREIFEK